MSCIRLLSRLRPTSISLQCGCRIIMVRKKSAIKDPLAQGVNGTPTLRDFIVSPASCDKVNDQWDNPPYIRDEDTVANGRKGKEITCQKHIPRICPTWALATC